MAIAAPVPESHNPDSGTGIRPRAAWIGWVGTALVIAAILPTTVGGLARLTVVEGAGADDGAVSSGDLVVSLWQPTYAPGDVVAVHPTEGRTDAGSSTIGRVVSRAESSTGTAYTIEADPDAGPAAAPIPAGDLIGQVVLRIPGAGILLEPVVAPFAAAIAAGVASFLLLRLGRRGRRPASDA